MDLTAFTLRRWLDRFKTEERVVAEQRADGRVPDATIEPASVMLLDHGMLA